MSQIQKLEVVAEQKVRAELNRKRLQPIEVAEPIPPLSRFAMRLPRTVKGRGATRNCVRFISFLFELAKMVTASGTVYQCKP